MIMASKIIINNNEVMAQISSYNSLEDSTKPMVNSVLLEGNKTSGELGMYTRQEVNQLLAQARNVRYVASLPSTPIANTLYYVGTAKPYNVYLYVENDAGTLERLDMGTTEIDLSEYQKAQDSSLATSSKTIVGAINENKSNIDLKQDKSDSTLLTTNKTIAGSINELKASIDGMDEIYAPLITGYSKQLPGMSGRDPDGCVFEFNGSITSDTRQVQTGLFAFVSMLDPIENSDISGMIETAQYFNTPGAYVMFEQTFTAYSNSTLNQTKRFRRKGEIQGGNAVSAGGIIPAAQNGLISWKAWYPVDYPTYSLNSLVGSPFEGTIWIAVSGGVMLFDFYHLRNTSGTWGDIISQNNFRKFSDLFKFNTRGSLASTSSDSICLIEADKGNGLNCLRITTGEYFNGQMVATLGY